MSKDNLAFPIPNEVLEPYIKEAVSTSIAAALGDGTDLIAKAVEVAMRDKVDSTGNKARYSTNNVYPFIEIFAKKKIQDIAREVINEMAEELRPQIRREIEESMRSSKSAIVQAMENALIEGLRTKWSVSVFVGES